MNYNSKLNSSKAINSKGTSGLEPKILPRKKEYQKIMNSSNAKTLLNTINNYGGYIRIPKTKRLDWNVVNEIESALHPKKGKRRNFEYENGEYSNKRDNMSEGQPSTSVTMPDSASSGSEALKGDFEVANNEYNNKNLLYRIIDRNKSYESINRYNIMNNYNRGLNSKDIHGASPNKFGHRIKKHVFENAIRNEEDSLTELLRNDPFSMDNNLSKIHRVSSNGRINSTPFEKVEFGIQTDSKIIEIPSKPQALIKRIDSEENYNSIDRLNAHSKLIVDPKENYYGSYLTERVQTHLPDIKTTSISADKKPVNVTFDDSNKLISKLDLNNSMTPSLHNKVNIDKKIRDLTYTPVNNTKSKVSDSGDSKLSYLNFEKFKEYLDNKKPILQKSKMPFDMIDKHLNIQVKQSFNSGFNPISNTYSKNLNKSMGY